MTRKNLCNYKVVTLNLVTKKGGGGDFMHLDHREGLVAWHFKEAFMNREW